MSERDPVVENYSAIPQASAIVREARADERARARKIVNALAALLAPEGEGEGVMPKISERDERVEKSAITPPASSSGDGWDSAERLRGALTFYADEANYDEDGAPVYTDLSPPEGWVVEEYEPTMRLDMGSCARQAIDDYDEARAAPPSVGKEGGEERCENCDLEEMARSMRHELEGEWLDDMEKLGFELVTHREDEGGCFSCSLHRMLTRLPDLLPARSEVDGDR